MFFLQKINFRDAFYAPPVVMVSPRLSYHNNNSRLSRSGTCNAVIAWVEVRKYLYNNVFERILCILKRALETISFTKLINYNKRINIALIFSFIALIFSFICSYFAVPEMSLSITIFLAFLWLFGLSLFLSFGNSF